MYIFHNNTSWKTYVYFYKINKRYLYIDKMHNIFQREIYSRLTSSLPTSRIKLYFTKSNAVRKRNLKNNFK